MPDQPKNDLGQRLAVAFWAAMEKCGEDDRVHDMDYPWHDNPRIDGEIPYVLWDHMAEAMLSLPGIAIVELPTKRLGPLTWPQLFTPHELAPAEMRYFAAKLLAAAVKRSTPRTGAKCIIGRSAAPAQRR